MRIYQIFNKDWKFHYGEIGTPLKTVRKAACIGGYTSVIGEEKGEIVPLGPGGHHFLKLISGGDEKKGLLMLAGTNFDTNLKDWRNINLPHDWKTELPYVDDVRLHMGGAKPDGVGYYRKTFKLDKKLEGKSISINFDGVCRSASVWFNGCFLGDNYSGYVGFSFDISDLARYGDEGENVILIRVDTTTGQEGWWYEGAGIYRNVYLQVTSPVCVDKYGVHISTEKIEDNNAYLSIETTLKNSGYNDANVSVEVLILKDKEVIHKKLSNIGIVYSLEKKTSKEEIIISNPYLWSSENPNLYKAIVNVIIDDKKIDEYETNFGIRTIKYTEDGLLLNEKKIEIKGVCEHQDFAVVGTALTKDIVKYKLLKLKEMGANAYRSAHHASSLELLELCDELGIMVMEENRILESSELRLEELERMIRRDRNHPSIIFWSLSNEEVIGSTPMAERMARRMASIVRRLDKERLLVSAELLNLDGIINPSYMDIFDIIGVNYPESAVMGEGLNNIKKRFPNKPIMSTENASYFSTRGIYEDNWDKCQTSNYGSCYSMFGPEKLPKDAPGAGGTAHPERVMEFYKMHPFMGGSFIWTAFDYCGEPAPFPYPAISSQFGIMDTCGFEKDYFYYYKSQWCDKPVIHAMPHWSFKDREGEEIEVRIFSNCEEGEIILNGRQILKKSFQDNVISHFVKYESGELIVRGYNQGELVAEDIKQTSGQPVKLQMRVVEHENNHPKENETVLVEVYAVDENNIEVPTADTLVTLDITGDGELIGMSNGNPVDHTDKFNKSRRLFSGKMLVIVQCREEFNNICIEAKAENCESVKLELVR